MSVVQQIILASKSPIRRKILGNLSLPFTAITSDVDESLIQSDNPAILASKRARAKAEAVAKKSSLALVIACDQVLSLEGEVFSKPKSEAEAFSHLRKLSGKEHTLFSAVCLYYAGEAFQSGFELDSWVSPAPMAMKLLSEKEIEDYVATAEWKGCVGAYRVEEKGGELFLPFEKDFDRTIIMGLPLRELKARLDKLGLSLDSPSLPFQIQQN